MSSQKRPRLRSGRKSISCCVIQHYIWPIAACGLSHRAASGVVLKMSCLQRIFKMTGSWHYRDPGKKSECQVVLVVLAIAEVYQEVIQIIVVLIQ